MDCGPAALKCLLEGFGIPVSYGRLREACQTDVDGTSIDTIEDVARQLGLMVEQVMMPVDYLFLSALSNIPALLVVRLPAGHPPFLVVWRTHGAFVQIMDPATGRRWLTQARLLQEVYRHTLPIATADWYTWAASAGFQDALG
ncbi:MAG: cysteine peptidase family C39 domain-containing protein [Caldilineaceae bacterium]